MVEKRFPLDFGLFVKLEMMLDLEHFFNGFVFFLRQHFLDLLIDEIDGFLLGHLMIREDTRTFLLFFMGLASFGLLLRKLLIEFVYFLFELTKKVLFGFLDFLAEFL